MRYLAVIHDLPFIEAIRWNQATPVLEGCAIGRLLCDGLDPCIDRGILRLRFIQPIRDQYPFCYHHFPAGPGVPDDRNLLRWCDVVARLLPQGRCPLRVEYFPDWGLRRV